MCNKTNMDLAGLLRSTADEMTAMRQELADLHQKYTTLIRTLRHANTLTLAFFEDEMGVERTIEPQRVRKQRG